MYKRLANLAPFNRVAYLEKCLAGTDLALVPDRVHRVRSHEHGNAHPSILHFGGLTRLGLRHLRDLEPVEINRGVLQPVRIGDEEINDTVRVKLMCLLQSRGGAVATATVPFCPFPVTTTNMLSPLGCRCFRL